MVENRIYGIAAKNGWSVSMSAKNGIHSYDFQRKTLSGVAFSFTAEVKDDKVSSLMNEIVSFVDAIHPDICAWEWMIKSGAMDSLVSASCGGYEGHKKQGMAVSLRLV